MQSRPTGSPNRRSAWLTASDLRIYDHYRSQVMLTESCEPSSPSVHGRFSADEPKNATASATDVQHHRRGCLDQKRPGVPPGMQSTPSTSAGTNRRSQTRHALGPVLHVCCTRCYRGPPAEPETATAGHQSARNRWPAGLPVREQSCQ